MKTISSTELYLRLLNYVAPYWRVFALALLGMMIVAATEPALPALLKPLLDGTFVEKDESLMRWMPLLIVGLFVVRGLAEYMAHYSIYWVGNQAGDGSAQGHVRQAADTAGPVLRRPARPAT